MTETIKKRRVEKGDVVISDEHIRKLATLNHGKGPDYVAISIAIGSGHVTVKRWLTGEWACKPWRLRKMLAMCGVE